MGWNAKTGKPFGIFHKGEIMEFMWPRNKKISTKIFQFCLKLKYELNIPFYLGKQMSTFTKVILEQSNTGISLPNWNKLDKKEAGFSSVNMIQNYIWEKYFIHQQ